MYLKGNKWNMNRRSRRRASPLRILSVLALLVAAGFYLNSFVIPKTPGFSSPTATPTGNPEAFTNEAETLFTSGKLVPAIDAYQKAIHADPSNRSTYVALARVQIFAGQYQPALENAEKSLVGNPNYSMGHALRGWALNFLGNYVEGEISEKQALELDPNDAMAHAFYAEILANRGEYGDIDKASSESKLAEQLAPTALETLRARGYVLYVTGNYNDSLQKYQAAISVNKYIADLFMYLGYNYVALQETDPESTTKAIEAFTQAKALSPKDPLPDLELSRTYLRLGEYEKAIQYGENAIKNDAENPVRYGNLGVIYYQKDDYVTAAKYLELAVRGGTSPDGVAVKGAPLDTAGMPKYYWYYGFALAKQTPDRCDLAVPIFQALLSGVPEDSYAVVNANAGLELCQENAGTPPAETTETPTAAP